MEILYWFLFFSIMIVLSYLSWLVIFGCFLFVILLTSSFINYNVLKTKDDLVSKVRVQLVDVMKILYLTYSILTVYLQNTYLGVKVYKILMNLENAYQDTKEVFRRKIIESAFQQARRFTPRVSYDSDDTDDE